MNNVTISGNLTKDVELRKTPNGKSVCNFTLGVYRSAEVTDFIPCQAWERQADYLAEKACKGDRVVISGSIKTSRADDGKGYIYVIANTLETYPKQHRVVDHMILHDDLPF